MAEHPELFLEDLKVGDRFRTGRYALTQEEIIAFARQYDPQPFHVDPEAAKASLFRGLAASGWHTASITMRLFITGPLRLAGGSIGLGVKEISWPRPTRPGDVLQAESEILELRPSRSRPDHGIARIRTVTTNQKGETVQTLEAAVMVLRRPV